MAGQENIIIILTRASAIWLIIILAESLHGIARRIFLEPVTGDFWARQIGVFVGSLIILAISFVSVKWLRPHTISGLVGIGAWWLILTALFEVMLGVFVMNLSVMEVASSFDLSKGELLPVGFLLMLLTPLIAAKIRGLYPVRYSD